MTHSITPVSPLAAPVDTLPDKLDWREGTLLTAEYTALSQHYFHEDNYFLRAIALFGTINAALLTLYGSELIVRLQFGIRLAFIFIGIVTTVAWAMSLIRVRYLRKKIEDRIEELEKSLNRHWISNNNPPPFPLLQIRNRQETHRYWAQRVPVSKLMLIVPSAFLIIWICISIAFISSWLSPPKKSAETKSGIHSAEIILITNHGPSNTCHPNLIPSATRSFALSMTTRTSAY